jgi:hypothetical protein
MVTQELSDLKEYLKENFNFLKSSAKAYDAGLEEEAKRIAVAIRTLVHDTNSSHSLLKQLNIKDQKYLDSASKRTGKEFGSYRGLTLMHHNSDGTWAFTPKCILPPKPGEQYSYKSFDQWWNGVVIIDNNENEFTRKQLVLALANKLGGAHVDPKLNQKFYDLYKIGSHGILVIEEFKSIPISGLELASVRQIAFELITVLEKELST